GTQQLRQAERVTAVGLHLVAWALWDQRKGYYHAFESKIPDLSVQPVARRPCLVAERQPLVFGGKLPNELRRCARCVLISPRNRTSPPRPASAIATAFVNFDVSRPTKASL